MANSVLWNKDDVNNDVIITVDKAVTNHVKLAIDLLEKMIMNPFFQETWDNLEDLWEDIGTILFTDLG